MNVGRVYLDAGERDRLVALEALADLIDRLVFPLSMFFTEFTLPLGLLVALSNQFGAAGLLLGAVDRCPGRAQADDRWLVRLHVGFVSCAVCLAPILLALDLRPAAAVVLRRDRATFRTALKGRPPRRRGWLERLPGGLPMSVGATLV